MLSTGLTYAFFWLAAATCLILGWVLDIQILFWIGVALFCYYVFVAAVALAMTAIGLAKEKTPKGRMVLRLLVYTVLLFVIGWFIWSVLAFVYTLVSIGLAIGLTITGIIAGPKTMRNSFLIMGALILLSGLVLELIGTFH